jgi:APA family basic amino acid/polyamine antiporter
MEDQKPDDFKEIGLLDGTMLVVFYDRFRIFIVSSDMVRQLGSAGWLLAMWVLTGTITVIAAVSYGELSAMFPKAGGSICVHQGSVRETGGFLVRLEFFAVIQTGTIAAVGGLLNLLPICMRL